MSAGGEARWYRHGWNRDLSWRLILGIVPRVPVLLRPPIHFVTTLVCFLAMGEERRAARRNLRVVAGRRGSALHFFMAFRLFYNFSKFMVGYIDLRPYGPGLAEARVRGREEAGPAIRNALARGRGLIVLGTHVGHWDAALVELTQFGRPLTVVMRREDEEASRHASAARAAAGVRVVHAGEGAFLLFDLLAALRRNEIVALHGDRAFGERTVTVSLFGRPARLPAGPWELARASGAPILPAVLALEGSRGYRHVLGDPIDPLAAAPPSAGGGSLIGGGADAAAMDGPRRIAVQIEALIRRFPTQWFNFYDFWGPGEISGGTRSDRR